MTAKTVVQLLLAIMQFANSIYRWLHEKNLIQEGEDRQIAKALAEMAARSTTLKAIESRFSKMSPEEVTRELSQDFRD